MFPILALSISIFLLLTSLSVRAHPPSPSPLHYPRRHPAPTHAPLYVQPHPGANTPYALSRRFIKDADYASGSSLPAFSDKSPHKRRLGSSDIGATTVQLDDIKEQLPPPRLPRA